MAFLKEWVLDFWNFRARKSVLFWDWKWHN